MRIRKNAQKLSPLLFSSSCVQGGSVPVDTHVCQLNQSPWDVIPFDSDSIQFQPDDDNNNNNGSAADSYFALESVASLMDVEHATRVVIDNDNSVAPNNFGVPGMANPCQGFDDSGKCWPCKNEARQGQAFCEHHLFNKKQTQPTSTGAAAHRRVKTRGVGKKTASSNPYEFYYYSGFGPSWGKRRGDRNGEESKSSGNSTMVESENGVGVAAGDEVVVDDEVMNDNVVVVPSVSEIDNEVMIDYEDDDEEEDEEDSGKKRMRKPVKARSLKSLM